MDNKSPSKKKKKKKVKHAATIIYFYLAQESWISPRFTPVHLLLAIDGPASVQRCVSPTLEAPKRRRELPSVDFVALKARGEEKKKPLTLHSATVSGVG